MGCTITSEFRVDDGVFGRSQLSANLLHNLGFSNKHLDILYTAFADIDANESGAVRINEVLKYFGIDNTKYMRVVFGQFEKDGCGCLNFLEFVVSIWNFLTIADFLLGQFTFELCENKVGGMIQSEDVIGIIDELYSNIGDGKKKKMAFDMIAKLKANRETFSQSTYKQYLAAHKSALFPLESIHTSLRVNIIGETYWQLQTEARTKVSGSIEQMAIVRTQVDTVRKEEMKMLYRKKRAGAEELQRAASLKREQSVYKKLADTLTKKTKTSRDKKKTQKKQKVAVSNVINDEVAHNSSKNLKEEAQSDAFDKLSKETTLPNDEKPNVQLSDIIQLPTSDRKRRSSMLLMKKPNLLGEDVVKRKASIFNVKHPKRNKPPAKKNGTGKYKVIPQKTTFADFGEPDRRSEDDDGQVDIGKEGWVKKRDADGEVSEVNAVIICCQYGKRKCNFVFHI